MSRLRDIFLFAGLITTGYITRFTLENLLRERDLYLKVVKYLVDVIYNVLIPISLLAIFLKRGLLYLDLLIAIYFTSLMALTYISLKVLKPRSDPSLFFVSTFPNSVFLGFPVVLILLGDINIAAVFGVLTVALNIIIPDLIAYRRISLRSIAASTPLLGFILGVMGHYLLGLSALSVYRYIEWTPGLLSYIATFTMGLRIPTMFRQTRGVVNYIVLTGLYRFTLAPLLALFVAHVTGIVDVDRLELIVVSMMPPAVMNAIIAEKYRWNSELVALTIAILTVFYLMIIFPLKYYVILHYIS